MFFILRFIFCGILFYFFVNFIKKSRIVNKKRSIIILFVLSFVLLEISSLIPIENLFITFKTPEQSYNYKYLEKVSLVVNGKETSFVMSGKNITIIPKKNGGWKLENSLKTKTIKTTHSDGMFIQIYGYKDSRDYYIIMNDTKGEIRNIKDNCNSEFYRLKSKTVNGKNHYDYYAYIKDFNNNYEINIDGKSIKIKLDSKIRNKNYEFKKINENSSVKYKYTIYNNDHTVIDKGTTFRIEPEIKKVDGLLELCVSAGTGLRNCRYYDTKNSKKSEWFETPIYSNGQIIICFNNLTKPTGIIVENIFDKSKYHKEYKINFSSEKVYPIENIEFINENEIEITYVSNDSDKIESKTITID